MPTKQCCGPNHGVFIGGKCATCGASDYLQGNMLACPFCGEGKLLMHPVKRQTGTFVHCNGCGAEAPEGRWNFRTNTSVMRENQRLIKALQFIESCEDLKSARQTAQHAGICAGRYYET